METKREHFGSDSHNMSYTLLSADERVSAVRLAVMPMRSRFGVSVEVVRRVEDVRDARVARAIRSGEDVKGWCDTKSGKVCLYAPNIENERDARSVYMHEVIAHKGMRGLLGEERYHELCERLGAELTDEQRQAVEEYAGSNDSVLGDEYIAHIAEELIDDRGEIKEPTVWAKIQAIVREIFRTALGLELTDADIHYMLWRSSERLRSGQADIFRSAQDMAKEQQRDPLNRRHELTETELERSNNIYNEQLRAFSATTADRTIFYLGRPNTILIAAGVEDRPLKLYGSKLLAKMKRHGFAANELFDLPRSLATPIAVFDNHASKGNRSILTELRTIEGNFLVIVDIGRGPDIDFDVVSSLFGKSDNKIINWLNNGLATYINKERALEYLHLSAPIAEAASNRELISAAKVIKEFENPKYSMRGNFSADNLPEDESADHPREETDYEREIREITERAKADGTYMRAPNGERSKLDERQWAHVRTTAFKRWFGDWELGQLYSQALRAWSDKESKGKTVIGLHGKAAQRLVELLGRDFTRLVITDDAIRHIKKQHGNVATEHSRGQVSLSAGDIVTIPYIIENFDTMELVPTQDDSMGNKAVEVRKRINGLSVVGTISRGKDKLFVVTSWRKEMSDALDVSATPGPNVRNDSDFAKIQKEIESIKKKAENCSRVVDANGEPKVVYHGTPNASFNIFDNSKKESDSYAVGAYNSSNDDIRLSIRKAAPLTKTGVSSRIGDSYDVKENPVGRAEPGLNGRSVAVVSVPRHDFKGSGKEAVAAAKLWAKGGNGIMREYSDEETGGKGRIAVTERAINRYFSDEALKKSKNIGVHLAVATQLPNIIKESADCESHPDFKKVEGERKPENGLASNDVIHRMYAAAELERRIYRVKLTVREQADKHKTNVAYSYEVVEIEVSGGSPYATDAAAVQPLSDAPNNSISLAKILKNVRMSYAEAGKDASEAEFLLDESRKRDEESLQMGGEGTLMTREGTNDEYVVFRPNQMKPAMGDMGSYDRGEDGIRFAIGHKRKEDMRKGLMSKLANASDEQVERTICEIEKLGERSKQGGDSKVEKAAYHWVQRGAILLPEDADKVLQAVRMADKYKVDVSKYDCPQQLIDEYLPRQQAGERIDPDTVKTLTNKQVVGDTGITIYNVANGEQGRKDMRKIINTHFGKSASPWCLLQGDGEGNLTPISKSYWKKYSAYPKRVAFKDGKLLAFFASDDKPIWWDRQDRPYVGIPVDGKIPNDELGRFGTIEYDEDGSIRRISDLYRGNKRDGLYEEWYDQDTKHYEQYFKNGQAEGMRRVWYANGRLMSERNYKDGLADGIYRQWHFNGQLEHEGEYRNGGRVGIHKDWWADGQLHSIEQYKDGVLDGLCKTWDPSGELESERYFKNGIEDGWSREWHPNGRLAFECNYKGGEREGIYRAWHKNGQIREESHYSNGNLDCLYGRWSEKGRLLEGSGLSAPDAVKTSRRAMGDGGHQQLSFDFDEEEELVVSSPKVAVSEEVRPRGRGR